MNSEFFPREKSADFFHTPPRFFLAPMEGVTDSVFREVITGIGGIDACVTEFMRVTTSLHPKKVFERFLPELRHGSRTKSGTPVLLQLLGGDPHCLSENAHRGAELGAHGIDLNFGCPARTVNRHDGGASLLQYPERLASIAEAVRRAVPAKTPVSAKIRLGFQDDSLLEENASALAGAGVSWITLHCRTKVQGYRPPAHWESAARVKEKISVPLVVNGDIFSLEDWQNCKKISGAKSFMLGRGALKNPFLFLILQQKKDLQFSEFSTGGSTSDLSSLSWTEVWPQVQKFYELCENKINASFATARTKQWLKFLSLSFREAAELFQEIKSWPAANFAQKMKTDNAVELALSNAQSLEKMKGYERIKHYFE